MKKTLTILLVLCLAVQSIAKGKSTENKMDWWQEAKFGMFVHWGPYCLYGGMYQGYKQQRGGAEWIMNRCKIPVAEYRAKSTTFNPTQFNADDLVLMAKNAGMKYLVFTTKHHDGFAMFRSEASNYNIVDYTKFGRDILDEVVKSCRKHGLKFGFYYSHAQDWNNGGKASRKLMKEGWQNPDSAYIDNYTKTHHGFWDARQLGVPFEDYFHKVAMPQMKELLTRYPDVSIMWFDTPGGTTDALAQEVTDLLKAYPHVIVNDRLKRPNFPGDYKTPEGRVPKPEDVKGIYWETCANIGSSWGYKSYDTKWKDTETVLKTLIMCAARGGNLLLNVGPDPMGIVPEQAQTSLRGVGEWIKKYGDIIYGSQRSELYPKWGEVIRKDNKSNTSLYLCVFSWPKDGKLALDGSFDVKGASLMSDNSRLGFSSDKAKTVINVGKRPAGEGITVIRLDLKKKLPVVKLISNTSRYFNIVDAD